jgi:hypothetical protein
LAYPSTPTAGTPADAHNNGKVPREMRTTQISCAHSSQSCSFRNGAIEGAGTWTAGDGHPPTISSLEEFGFMNHVTVSGGKRFFLAPPS